MPTLCRAYATEEDALAAVDRLVVAGIPGADVRVLMGDAVHDSRDAPAGAFAGTVRDGDPAIGSYAGAPHSAREAMGSFAGDADRRRGGYSDVDRETVTTYAAGVERVRIASHRALRTMLLDAGLDEAAADADVEALHRGQVLVLARSPRNADELGAALDG
jgi:hypothetical protein